MGKHFRLEIKSFVILSSLVGAHLIWLNWIAKQLLVELVFLVWLLNNSQTLVTEEYFLHPPLLPNLLSWLMKIVPGFSLSFSIFQALVVTLLDAILFFYLKNKYGVKYAIIGLLFYIPWQVFFRGNALWFDLVTIPFIAISYIYFEKFTKNKSVGNLALASSILSLGYFFKQTVFWILIFYFFWISSQVFKKKVDFNKYFRLVALLLTPMFVAVLINSTILVLKSSLPFALQWSLIIPFFIFPRLSTFSRFISTDYQPVVALLFAFFALSVFAIEKSRKLETAQRLFLYLFTFFNISYIFPWWSDFRLQPFVFFVSILFVGGIYFSQFLSKKDLKIFQLVLIVLCIAALAVLINRIKIEIKQKGEHKEKFVLNYVPDNLSGLLNRKNVFGYDTVLNLNKIQNLDKNKPAKLLIPDPDQYYRSFVPIIALDYVFVTKPDIIILPFQIHDRIVLGKDLTVFEKFVLYNYSNFVKINDFFWMHSKKLEK